MVKTFFKLFLCTIIYLIVFVLANALMPFSQSLKDLGQSDDPLGMLYLLIISTLVCFTIYYVIRHSQAKGAKLLLNIVFVMFFVQLFMAQIETLLFGHAFPALTKLDVVLIMLAGLIPLLATIPLMVKFFQNKDVVNVQAEVNLKGMFKKLGALAIIYPVIYFLFGYFVAWQFEALRILYSGSAEKLNLWMHLLNNDPLILLFQILRGMLFGILVIPLKNMMVSKRAFIISVCLVFLYLGYVFLLPNVLFPDMARLGHFLEMTSSMTVFGIIVGNIMWWEDRKTVRP